MQAPLLSGRTPLPSVVGYQQKGVTAGEYQMLGMQFTDLADSEGKVAIDKLVGMPDIAAQNWGDSRCARIMTLREDGHYDYFYFINDAYDADNNEVEGDVWTDEDGYVLTDESKVKAGTGAWFYSTNSGVANSGTIDFENSAYTMQASPIPAALDLRTVTTTGLVAQNWGDSRCARIMTLRDDGHYDYFYFINDAYDANNDEVEGDVWTDEDGYVLTNPAAGVGEAFWCYASQIGAISVAL